jgi:competence protein ComEC
MVDCGGSYADDAADVAAGMLLSQGVTQLDGLILTHYDTDHVGGASYLLGRVPAEVLILPVGEDEKGFEEKLLADFRGEVIWGDRDLQITWGDSTITIFASQYFGNSNETSLCVLFQEEECDILITGDRGILGETILLHSADVPQLDVLIAGHHGSSGSTGEALLAATSPKQVVISVGANNPYRHPSKATLERLAAFGCRVRRTDQEGTIIIRG